MLPQMVRRLLLPSVFIIVTGFVLVQVFLAEVANSALVFYLTVTVELILIPALFMVLFPLALISALRERQWIWALVLALIAVLLVALPTLYAAQLNDSLTPFTHWVRQLPPPWSDVVAIGLWHGIWL